MLVRSPAATTRTSVTKIVPPDILTSLRSLMMLDRHDVKRLTVTVVDGGAGRIRTGGLGDTEASAPDATAPTFIPHRAYHIKSFP
jgi:hypothetical protein